MFRIFFFLNNFLIRKHSVFIQRIRHSGFQVLPEAHVLAKLHLLGLQLINKINIDTPYVHAEYFKWCACDMK